MTQKIFNFMDKYLIKEKKYLSWEDFISFFIKKTKSSIYTLDNQKFFWTNVNRYKDYISIKNL